MNKLFKIILVHGIHCNANTLSPFKWTLNKAGYTNVKTITYLNSGKYSLNDSIESANYELNKIVTKKEPIVLVGQSLGGIVAHNMYKYNYNIIGGYYMVTPFNGSRLLQYYFNNNKFIEIYPKYNKQIFTDINELSKYNSLNEIYNFPIRTISGGIFDFDSKIFKDETILDKRYHKHIPFTTHGSVIYSPRVHYDLLKFLKYNIIINN
jgi:esterase/lipase